MRRKMKRLVEHQVFEVRVRRFRVGRRRGRTVFFRLRARVSVPRGGSGGDHRGEPRRFSRGRHRDEPRIERQHPRAVAEPTPSHRRVVHDVVVPVRGDVVPTVRRRFHVDVARKMRRRIRQQRDVRIQRQHATTREEQSVDRAPLECGSGPAPVWNFRRRAESRGARQSRGRDVAGDDEDAGSKRQTRDPGCEKNARRRRLRLRRNVTSMTRERHQYHLGRVWVHGFERGARRRDHGIGTGSAPGSASPDRR